ncbi:Glutamate racemase [Halomicronema hongdechloris C2206]|uniref:Glutamate racemase n=1 Tax=Halomicronema hongdechloris C2206 TaxID=1641165 RepID=A0A1Z3HPP5_9CYAN|nr:glutamate racemase [Halomicronema hongdechloris]ASC72222.1 Glutamate racemase [Halomicronema hongdechloris C2206]
MNQWFSPSGEHTATAQIGVFDSGVGGLTVLRELRRQLPDESILYFGDTARLPYGTRSASDILYFVRQILTWMMERQVKMVIMACNTSSALALEQVQQEFPIPILGLIHPAGRAAASVGRRIGVIATPATIASDAYRQAILEANAHCRVWQVACPQFVPLIEQNHIHSPQTRRIARNYLAPLVTAHVDTLVYGCTHYPHLAPVLESLLPSTMTYIDPAVHLVAAAAKELDILGLRRDGFPLPTQFYVSGQPQSFTGLATQWLQEPITVQQIKLPAIPPTITPAFLGEAGKNGEQLSKSINP